MRGSGEDRSEGPARGIELVGVEKIYGGEDL
jgi:hypothetical protein